MDVLKEKVEKIIWVMENLREKCPWDKKQCHETLARYLQEEAFEVIEAIYSGDRTRLKEELGDLLFQILFHARIAEENDTFDLGGVIDTLAEKMISRHPHVFGDCEKPPDNEQALRDFWNEKKAKERKGSKELSLKEIASQKGPSLVQKAVFAENYAARKGFDWRSAEEILDKLEEEIQECRESLKKGKREEISEEIGDMILVLTNLCRFLHISFERSLEDALIKFGGRFDRLREKVNKTGKPMEEYSIEKLEEMWQEIKN